MGKGDDRKRADLRVNHKVFSLPTIPPEDRQNASRDAEVLRRRKAGLQAIGIYCPTDIDAADPDVVKQANVLLEGNPPLMRAYLNARR